jgi:hypothetical protein
MVLSLECQWIRVCGGACHAAISHKKIVSKFGEIKLNLENCTKAGKMYVKK